MERESIKASLDNVSMSKEGGKMIISGCIAKVGEPSTGSPCGAGGYLICFTQEAVDKCAKSFEGMPINVILPDEQWAGGYEAFSGHGDSIVGYMRKVKQKDTNLMAEIVLWKENNPWLAEMTVSAMDALGFSVEMYPTTVHNDDKKGIQYIDEFEGTGCAMLWSSSAAFSQTFIEKIAASRSDKMNEEMKKFVEEQIQAANVEHAKNLAEVTELIGKLNASVEELVNKQKEMAAQADEIKASVEEVKTPAEPQVAEVEVEDKVDEVAELKAELEAIKASIAQPAIPTPKAGQVPAENPNFGDDKEAKYKAAVEKINASKMSPLDKLKAIARANTEMKG